MYDRPSLRVIIGGLVGFVVLAFIVAQGITLASPQFQPTNPPIENQVNWDSPQTEQLWRNACNDCHANDTNWPFYAYVAPTAWLVVPHVTDGRAELNIHTPGDHEAEEMIETIRDGSMPLPGYTTLHPEANLTETEQQQLIDGLRATFGGGEDDDDDMETTDESDDTESDEDDD